MLGGEDSEKIGGISIEIGGEDSGLEAMLDRLLAKMEKVAQAASGLGNVRVGAAGGTGAGGTSRAASSTTLPAGQAPTRAPAGSTGAAAIPANLNQIVAAVMASVARQPALLARIDKAHPGQKSASATPDDGGAEPIRRATVAREQAHETGRAVARETVAEETRAPRRPRRAAAAVDEEGAPQGNRGGRVQVLKRPQTALYDPVSVGGNPFSPAPMLVHRMIRVAHSPQERAAREQAAEDARAQKANDRVTLEAMTAQQLAAGANNPRMSTQVVPPRVPSQSPYGQSPSIFAARANAGYQNAPNGALRLTSIGSEPVPARAAASARTALTPSNGGPTTRPGFREQGTHPGVNMADAESEKERKDRKAAEEKAAKQKAQQQERDRRQEDAAEASGIERSASRAQATELRLQRAGISRVFKEAEIQRSYEQARATQEASITSAGRTARTTASGLGNFLGGPRRVQIEAQATLTAERANLRAITAQRAVFTDEMVKRENAANFEPNHDRAQELRDEAEAIRNRPDYKKVLTDEASATEKVAVAQAKVESLGKGFTGLATAARSLLSVTVAGAAFGLGLKAIDFAMQAGEKAAAPYFDRFTAYAQKTADLTTALADQARATQGNAEGVTALKLAQTGFSTAAAQTIQPVVSQRVQIEAGNKALVDQIEMFRMANNLRKQSATAGIGGGGTGGILGTSLFGIPSTGEQTGNFLKGLNDLTPEQLAKQRQGYVAPSGSMGIAVPSAFKTNAIAASVAQSTRQGLDFINAQLKQGGGQGSAQLEQAMSAIDPRIEQTARAFDGLSPEMAAAVRELHLFSSGITDTTSAISALRSLNLAGTLTGPAEQLSAQRIAAKNAANQATVPLGETQSALSAEQARLRPSIIGQIRRQQAWGMGTEIPSAAALANLANPLPKVGTGIAPANAAERRRMEASQGTPGTGAIASQTALNAQYAEGRKIIEDTYKPAIIANFGTAAGAVFSSQLSQIQKIGSEMVSIQSGISNKQAAYQTAQYNYQLFIARRTLSDIAGLTGSAAFGHASTLGILERQNLLLGRQAQMLSFGMSQRQINFQVATAGFAAPGTTAESRAANIKEAKIEADYAQKQLDIQKKMFGNQVQIVDIGNLRQGTDLMRQIGLLTQGRQITFDTAVANEQLGKLAKRQEILTAQVGTYMTAVGSLASQAMGEMTALEAAYGHALTKASSQVIANLYGFYSDFIHVLSGTYAAPERTPAQGRGGVGSQPKATGMLQTTSGTQDITIGEAGRETVAVLRNPRTLLGAGLNGSLGGGGGINFTFINNAPVRNDGDLYAIKRMVLDILNQKTAMQGLRGAVLS
jgi:hypothetical protein